MTSSINNFSITKIQTIQTPDGWSVRCNILYQNKLIGEYYNPGLGSMGIFEGDQSKIELLKDFPTFKVDCGEGIIIDCHWDIDVLVTRLIELNDIKKKLSKEKYVIGIYNKKTRMKSYAYVPRKLDKEIALERLKEEVPNGEFRVYWNEGDLQLQL